MKMILRSKTKCDIHLYLHILTYVGIMPWNELGIVKPIYIHTGLIVSTDDELKTLAVQCTLFMWYEKFDDE